MNPYQGPNHGTLGERPSRQAKAGGSTSTMGESVTALYVSSDGRGPRPIIFDD